MMWDDDGDPTENYLAWPEAKLFISHSGSAAADDDDVDYDDDDDNKDYDDPELQKRADRADQSVIFFLAGAIFWEKHAKNRRKQAKTRENMQKTGAFLVLIFGKSTFCPWLISLMP